MRTTSSNMDAVLAKRAGLLDEKVERAKVRRARALRLGNKREAEGAERTVQDARDSARRLRAMIGSKPNANK